MSDLFPGPHQGPLKEELRTLFASRTRDEWVQFASERDCCLEPVLTPEEARTDEHLTARRVFFEMASPWGLISQMRTPLASRDRSHASPPRQGEHTTEILTEAGFAEADIASMRAAGTIR